VVPFLMFVLAVAGLLDLNSVCLNHVTPEIRTHVSAAVFSVISSAVNKAFSGRQLLWATFGGGLALWQVSGTVRAVMGAFDRIYGACSERPFVRRYLSPEVPLGRWSLRASPSGLPRDGIVGWSTPAIAGRASPAVDRHAGGADAFRTETYSR
jgi:hypothetical protein